MLIEGSIERPTECSPKRVGDAAMLLNELSRMTKSGPSRNPSFFKKIMHFTISRPQKK
jgi:hypothetical protein